MFLCRAFYEGNNSVSEGSWTAGRCARVCLHLEEISLLEERLMRMKVTVCGKVT